MGFGSQSARSASVPEVAPVLVLGPGIALTGAATEGVRLFERTPPVHSVLLGAARLTIDGRDLQSHDAVALPANVAHRLTLEGAHACIAYLDPRRYRFADAARLAQRWRWFIPGQDDLREAMGDALSIPERRIDRRLRDALDALERADVSVASLAAKVRLSTSRLTHLMTDELGAPPRVWRAWFRLRRAIAEAAFGGANLTQAAHRAGFADSAHLTRTCKQLTGVRPAQMMPKTVYVEA